VDATGHGFNDMIKVFPAAVGVTIISPASAKTIMEVVSAQRLTLAETKRFELLKVIKPYLVSSEAHSTGLCDVSKW
jgi:uncharacterized membrane protein